MRKGDRVGELMLGGAGLAVLRSWELEPEVARSEIDFMVTQLHKVEESSWAAAGPTVRSVGDGYAEWAAVYDAPGNPVISSEQGAVWRLLASYPTGVALDAACGTGRHAKRLAELGHEVRGVDVSLEMLDQARPKVPGASFDLGRLDALPLADSSVDLAVCALALTHEADPEPAIKELARVVRPGGHVIISDVHPIMVGLGMHAFYTGTDGNDGVVPNYVHLPSVYLSAFRATGLEVTDCVETLWGPEEALTLPWADERPNLWRSALAGLPMTIVWETTRSAD
jgi:ubiquinone/menaquinone biosynthesis C-methylase UbiE